MPNHINLINGYKLSFFGRRYLQTWLGGPRIAFGEDSPPCSIYFAQILLLLLPSFFGVPCTTLSSLGVLSVWVASAISGGQSHGYLCFVPRARALSGFGLLYYITAQLFANLARRCNAGPHTSVMPALSLSDEDTPDIGGCCTASAASFLIPPRSHWVHVVVQGILSAALLFSAPALADIPYGEQRSDA